MKKIIVEIKKDKDNTYFVKVSEDMLPAFQKMIVNGCDDETLVDFRIEDKDLKEVETIEVIDKKDNEK